MIKKEFYVKDRRATAITSMTRVGDIIYLGLTGGSNALAKFDTQTEEITMCTEVFPWLHDKTGYCTKIHNSMGKLSDGSILLGEGNHFTWDGIVVYESYLQAELSESFMQRKKEQGFSDIKYSEFCLRNLEDWNRMTDDPGGKIVRYDPKTDTIEVIADLPKYLYSQSMVVDSKRDIAYGHTIPDNHFFAVDVKNKTLTDYGHISDYANHNMFIAPNGNCYGGWMDIHSHSLKLLKYDIEKQRLIYTNNLILQDVGLKVAGNQGIDQSIVTKSGDIFVGMVSNSLLFHFDYKTEEFELIGQAGKTGRVTTLDEDENGIIWIGAGHPHMHLIRFDPKEYGKKRFIDYGVVDNQHKRCYFHSSVYHKGKLYFGETDGFTPSLHVIDLNSLKEA